MPAISRTSNPTGVLKVDGSALALRVIKGAKPSDPKTFFVERFISDKLGLLPSLKVSCIATAGQTSQYFDLGTLGSIDLSPKTLSEIATDAALRFRVIFSEPHDWKIIAAADNIRALDEAQLSQSLIAIEPGQLNGPLWKLELGDSSSESLPVIHVEQQLFTSAKAAAANGQFVSYVLPEALRQIASRVASEWDGIDFEGTWLGKWAEFLGAMHPADLDGMDSDERGSWAEECVELFCRRGHMAMTLTNYMTETGGNV